MAVEGGKGLIWGGERVTWQPLLCSPDLLKRSVLQVSRKAMLPLKALGKNLFQASPNLW